MEAWVVMLWPGQARKLPVAPALRLGDPALSAIAIQLLASGLSRPRRGPAVAWYRWPREEVLSDRCWEECVEAPHLTCSLAS